jgi:nucleotide-binding universal stress UspA family protein
MTLGARVLVPLDGTPFAEQALPLARLVARRAGGALLVAHVVEPPLPVSEIRGAVVADPATTRELRRAAQDYVDDVVARLTRDARARRSGSTVPPIPTAPLDPELADGPAAVASGRFGDVADVEVPVHGVLLDGDRALVLHDTAVAHGADLIVMASHDRSAFGRLVFGSTAADLAREPGVPVLVVRDAGDGGASAGAAADVTAVEAARLHHVLVALDGSPESEAVLAPALDLARLMEAAVTLASVEHPRRERIATRLPTALLAPDGDDAERPVDAGVEAPPGPARYLETLAARLRADGHRVDARVVEGRDVAAALVQCAADVRAELIALSTEGRGLWGRLLQGSVAEAVLHDAAVPVLVLRPA